MPWRDEMKFLEDHIQELEERNAYLVGELRRIRRPEPQPVAILDLADEVWSRLRHQTYRGSRAIVHDVLGAVGSLPYTKDEIRKALYLDD